MVERKDVNGMNDAMFLNLHVDGLMGFFSCNQSARYLDVDDRNNRFFMADWVIAEEGFTWNRSKARFA